VRRIVSLALLLPALAAGCGGGSAETTTQVTGQQSAVPATKTDYIELADAICRNHQSRREDLESQARELGPLTSPAKAHKVADLLREESRNLAGEASELQARQPPAADRIRVGLILQSILARARAIDRWAGAYDDLDEPAIQRGQVSVGRITADTERRARAYGFSACGR
jgi:hypothetical protein